MVKLKPEIKEQWLARLRSGQDRQITQRLGDGEGGFCCLGVLCELAVEAGILTHDGTASAPDKDDATIDLPVQRDYAAAQMQSATTVLPAVVVAWAFPGDHDTRTMLRLQSGGWPSAEPRQDSLANMNDRGITFAKIADVIEKAF